MNDKEVTILPYPLFLLYEILINHSIVNISKV